ncbi:MAG: hypothetical protein ACLFRY_01765 [Spirochaetia bacterium]
METIVYVLTPVLTIFWSVAVFITWHHRAALKEDSFFRFYHILAPGSYFLAGAVSGFGVTFFRFDIAVLLYLDGIIFLSVLLSFIIFVLGKKNVGGRFTGVLVFYNVVSIAGIVAAYIIKNSPLLVMRISSLIEEASRIEIPSFSELTLDSVSSLGNLTGWVNRILIALFTYVPVALLRFLYVTRRRKRLEKQVCELEARIWRLEEIQEGEENRTSGT